MPAVELFDLRDDPGERHDLAGSRPDMVKKMDGALTSYFNTEAVRLGLEAQLPARDREDLRRKLDALGYVGR